MAANDKTKDCRSRRRTWKSGALTLRGIMRIIQAVAALSLIASFACEKNNSSTRPAASTPTRVPWTVLVFMNGDNNLEEYAIKDFLEMAAVGSSDSVNVVVQFDRYKPEGSGRDYNTSYGNWGQTLRFRISKGMTPLRQNALKGFEQEADMGEGATLRDFVRWGQDSYPARRYALV